MTCMHVLLGVHTQLTYCTWYCRIQYTILTVLLALSYTHWAYTSYADAFFLHSNRILHTVLAYWFKSTCIVLSEFPTRVLLVLVPGTVLCEHKVEFDHIRIFIAKYENTGMSRNKITMFDWSNANPDVSRNTITFLFVAYMNIPRKIWNTHKTEIFNCLRVIRRLFAMENRRKRGRLPPTYDSSPGASPIEVPGASRGASSLRPPNALPSAPEPIRLDEEESKEEEVVSGAGAKPEGNIHGSNSHVSENIPVTLEARAYAVPVQEDVVDTVYAEVYETPPAPEETQKWHERPLFRACMVGNCLLALILVVGIVALVLYLTKAIGYPRYLRSGGTNRLQISLHSRGD